MVFMFAFRYVFCLNKINRQFLKMFLCASCVFLNLQDQSSCLKFETIKLPSDWKEEEGWTPIFLKLF